MPPEFDVNEDIQVEPMTEEFLLWRCLHGGPLTPATIDQLPAEPALPWERYRQRNLPLLRKLTQVYGACAIVARVGPTVVGQLRFYPRAIWRLAGELCLQQDHPAGPLDTFAETEFPPLERLDDKTLSVHCLMTGSSLQAENPYQRRGIGSRLVRSLVEWASARGWETLETHAFEDLPLIYEVTGGAGVAFWEKLGFVVVDRHPHPCLQEPSEFRDRLEAQAAAAGIPVARARDDIVMCRTLRPSGEPAPVAP